MKLSMALAALMLSAAPVLAQTGPINGLCQQGGVSATTQALGSTNKLLGIVPSCTVTVYLTGTQTLATIYKDANNTALGNPFTANALGAVAPGSWLFYVLETTPVNVVLSGGIAPNVYLSPVTLTGLGGNAAAFAGCSGNPPVTPTGIACQTTGIPRPVDDVTRFGCVGDGTTNDQACVQATYDALWGNGTGVQPYGGTVLFPAGHTYIIGDGVNPCTLNIHDSISTLGGSTGAGFGGTYSGGALGPPFLRWNCPVAGTVLPVTGFVSAANTTYFPPSSLCVVAPCSTSPPATSTRAPPFARSLTFTQSNTLAVGNWEMMTGCTGGGLAWNNKKMQVAFANTSSFVLTTNVGPTGTITDTCTLTTINVRMATDAYGNSEEQFNNIGLNDITGAPAAGVGILIQSRADARTLFLQTFVDVAQWADYDFEAGGLNVEFDQGWRSDGCTLPGGGNIYWSVGSQDRLYLGPGQFGSNCTYKSGAQLLIDNENPLNVNVPGLTVVDAGAGWEQDTSIAQGDGQIKIVPNTSLANPGGQVTLNLQGQGPIFGQGAAGAWGPAIMVNPPMDGAVQVNWLNGTNSSGAGNNQTVPIVGMGSAPGNYGGGVMPLFVMGNSFASLFNAPTSNTSYPAARLAGDVFIHSSGHVFQDKVLSSMFRYVDTAFAALPSGTSLVPGELLAPPTSCWQAGGKRCALDSVITAGTTGTASNGNLTAITTATALQYQLSSPSMAIASLTCSGSSLTITGASNTFNTAGGDNVGVIGTAETFLNNGYWKTTSATGTTAVVPFQCPAGFTGNPSDTGFVFISQTHDLQNGQTFLAVGAAQSAQIEAINALNPMAVLLTMSRALGTVSSPAAFNFVAPVLGLEIQLPTKSAAAPSTLAWSEGDVEQMSTAAVNGPCLLVATTAGTPGTWSEIPCGNAAGVLLPAQASVFTGIGTYTTATSDAFTVTGATASSHCFVQATNALAAANTVVPYVSSVTTNSVTVTHVATTASGGTVNILCTGN
jgi:hypothetical protein